MIEKYVPFFTYKFKLNARGWRVLSLRESEHLLTPKIVTINQSILLKMLSQQLTDKINLVSQYLRHYSHNENSVVDIGVVNN